MRKALGYCALVCVLTSAESFAADLFDYSREAPFDVRIAGETKRGSTTIQDLSFSDGADTRIRTYLIKPKLTGIDPGVLFVHWLDGAAPDSNRTEFLEEAVDLAESGVESILIDAMWSSEGWFRARRPENDLKNTVQQIVQMRRSLDLLVSQAQVDARRIAFVGHDFGAMCGAVLSGIERRIAAWVLLAGTTSFSDWYLFYPEQQGPQREKFIAELSVLDRVRYVARAAPSAVLFQFGRSDRFVSEEKANEFFRAASEPKEIHFYDAGHALNQQAMDDRVRWLASRLALSRLVLSGARAE